MNFKHWLALKESQERKVPESHRKACEAQGKPNGVTALGYGCGDSGSTPQKSESRSSAKA